MNRRLLILSSITVIMLGLYGCVALKSNNSLPTRHNALFKNRPPLCTDCHKPRTAKVQFERFNHTGYFLKNHRQEAYQGANICALCHQQNFCSDCHGVGNEIKPSLKKQAETYRRLHHRGDYLGRHRIDGRIDPSSCIRCHGNPKTAKTCAKCHG